MTALQGKELLKLIRENPGKSAKQLAELAGHTTKTKEGKTRVRMLSFQKAVLEANNISLAPQDEKEESVRGGRKANFRIQVQQNGNLLIGGAYTRQMGLKPGTEFEIQINRKSIKLLQLRESEDGESDPAEMLELIEASK